MRAAVKSVRVRFVFRHCCESIAKSAGKDFGDGDVVPWIRMSVDAVSVILDCVLGFPPSPSFSVPFACAFFFTPEKEVTGESPKAQRSRINVSSGGSFL